MSVDVSLLANDLSTLLNSGILALGAYRAVQIGRALVTGVYRNRAFWTAGALVVLTVTGLLNTFVPFFSGSTVQASVIDSFLSSLPGTAQFMFIFALVDGTVLASMEMDFFHRDTLGWKRTRKPAYVAMLLSLVGAGTLGSNAGTGSFWVGVIGFVVIFSILGFSVATLILASRRTPDRTMKRFVRLLGFALGSFLLALAWFFSTPNVLAFNLIGNFLFTVPSYLVYRAVMSLSPLSRIEMETIADSKLGGTGAVPLNRP